MDSRACEVLLAMGIDIENLSRVRRGLQMQREVHIMKVIPNIVSENSKSEV